MRANKEELKEAAGIPGKELELSLKSPERLPRWLSRSEDSPQKPEHPHSIPRTHVEEPDAVA